MLEDTPATMSQPAAMGRREEPMAPEVLRYLFTVDEFERMGEGRVFGEDSLVELFDGEIVKLTPIGAQHAGCVDWLTHTIASRAGTNAVVRIQGPVVLDEHTELYPDVMVLKYREDSYRRAHPRPADVLLVIEVADTSAEYDRTIRPGGTRGLAFRRSGWWICKSGRWTSTASRRRRIPAADALRAL